MPLCSPKGEARGGAFSRLASYLLAFWATQQAAQYTFFDLASQTTGYLVVGG